MDSKVGVLELGLGYLYPLVALLSCCDWVDVCRDAFHTTNRSNNYQSVNWEITSSKALDVVLRKKLMGKKKWDRLR